MAEIVLKSNKPTKASVVLKEVLDIETLRVKHSLKLAKKRLEAFERRYNISSETFLDEWSAEDLHDGDMEYVEWAGEYQLASKLNERLDTIQSIEYVVAS